MIKIKKNNIRNAFKKLLISEVATLDYKLNYAWKLA